ncbi:MAG: competence/damage-inducible protein A [Calditrichaceae bacterium]|nr:competence/damage-inducible protein A [Calditrichaceae bacterium]MBN2710004.1 competence/damage-inducible protein A [Calditrichaceae bacterium]RQV97341.1 MAG: competence/damage-inducible protein A [Calditrichota bacterium]
MKMYKAEIISIGDEVLAGYTINTNASFISQQLALISLPVRWITTVSDDHDDIIYSLKTANGRADVVLITGGLGPTPDDITKKSICEYFNRPMVYDEKALADVESFLKQRKRTLTDANRLQAVIPKSDEVIYNWAGTAPGLILEKDGTTFIFMPGVPVEMKAMVNKFVLNYLSKKLKLPALHTRLLRTTGIAESTLYERLEEIINKNSRFPVAFLPRQIGVDLRFRYIGDNAQDINAFNQFVESVRSRIQKYVFTDKEEDLEEVIGHLLKEKELTLSTAESFTGGLAGDRLTNIPGSSDYFLGGVITYSNESKVKILNVKPETLADFGAVSKQIALEMARGVKIKFSSDCSIAATGIAGPGGATDKKPVGLAYIAAVYRDKELVRKFLFGENRLINKNRGVMAGMELLRQLLLDIK